MVYATAQPQKMTINSRPSSYPPQTEAASTYAWAASKESTHSALLAVYNTRCQHNPRLETVHQMRAKCDALESATVEHEYREEILLHMLAMEKATMCDPSMIDTQPEIQWSMRPFLLDFLSRSHLSLRLNHETLFLAINIIDRYSSQRIVFVRHYQLLGCTALWIASKYQDKKTRVPTLEELKTLCSNSYDSTMFTQMELHILNTLEWSIGHPTVDLFIDMCFQNSDLTSIPSLTHGSNAKAERTRLRHIVLFLCENANFHQNMLGYTPSAIASAAFKLGVLIVTMGQKEMPSVDMNESGCIDALAHHSMSPTGFLERKYSIPEFSRAYQTISQFHEVRRQQIRQRELEKSQQARMAQHLQKSDKATSPMLHRQNSSKVTSTPKKYPPQLTPVTTPLHSQSNLEIQVANRNNIGYMTPPFTPEENEIPGSQKNQRHPSQLSRSSSVSASAHQQHVILQQQKLKQQPQKLYEDDDDENDLDYVDEDYEEDWEGLQEEMAYEYNYQDDPQDIAEERAHLADNSGYIEEDSDIIVQDVDHRSSNSVLPSALAYAENDDISDNESLSSLNSMESGSKVTDTMTCLSSMPSLSSINIPANTSVSSLASNSHQAPVTASLCVNVDNTSSMSWKESAQEPKSYSTTWPGLPTGSGFNAMYQKQQHQAQQPLYQFQTYSQSQAEQSQLYRLQHQSNHQYSQSQQFNKQQMTYPAQNIAMSVPVAMADHPNSVHQQRSHHQAYGF